MKPHTTARSSAVADRSTPTVTSAFRLVLASMAKVFARPALSLSNGLRSVACITLLMFATTAFAEDFYIAQNTLGNGSGSSASNARSVAWFNTASNWSSPTKTSGKIGPGDTVRLVGTIQSPLTIQASGTSEARIHLLFAKDARMTSPSWSGSGAIIILAKNYITVDGGENGVIENTANGSAEKFPNSVGSVGVHATNSNFVTVENLTIRNLYVRTSTSDTNHGGVGVRVIPTSGNTFTGLKVRNCTISDVETGVSVNYRTDEVTDIELSHNTVYNVNHGLRVGDSQTSSRCSNVRIHNNVTYGFSKWDEPGSNKFHHNGIFCFAANSGSQIRNLEIYSNVVGSDFGRYATSGMYFYGTVIDLLIYNNIGLGTIDTPANGLVAMRLKDGSSAKVLNNTFIGNGQYGRAIYLNGVDGGVKFVDIINNIATRITFVAVTYHSSWSMTAEHNLGSELVSSKEYSYSSSSTGAFRTPAQWRSMGFDLNGFYVDAILDSIHKPKKGSPAIDSGKDLSQYFKTDKNGVIRPVGAGWDIGAYESLEGLTGIISTPSADSDQLAVIEPSTESSTGSTSDQIVIDFDPEPEPVTSEPILVADSTTETSTSSGTDGSTSSGNTLEPAPTTTEPILVADSSTSSGSTSEPEPTSTTETTIVVVDSSTSTETTTSPTKGGKGKTDSTTRGNSGKPIKTTAIF